MIKRHVLGFEVAWFGDEFVVVIDDNGNMIDSYRLKSKDIISAGKLISKVERLMYKYAESTSAKYEVNYGY